MPERLVIWSNAVLSNDYLSTMLELILLNIARRLAISDLYNLSVLYKSLRYSCIMTSSFQNLVRDQLKGTFVLPVPAEFPPHHLSGFTFPAASGD